jgi:hypothetical protein
MYELVDVKSLALTSDPAFGWEEKNGLNPK